MSVWCLLFRSISCPAQKSSGHLIIKDKQPTRLKIIRLLERHPRTLQLHSLLLPFLSPFGPPQPCMPSPIHPGIWTQSVPAIRSPSHDNQLVWTQPWVCPELYPSQAPVPRGGPGGYSHARAIASCTRQGQSLPVFVQHLGQRCRLKHLATT